MRTRSNKNTWGTSWGDRIDSTTLEKRIRVAKQKFIAELQDLGMVARCMAKGHNVQDERLDCSHIISVDRCKKMGKAELAYDTSNLQLESRSEHLIWESGSSIERQQQNNYELKMDYLEKHDREKWVSMRLAEDYDKWKDKV